jgi:hypothetical protein
MDSFVFSPKAGFWQEPEPSQATGMALAHCILGSFLGVGCIMDCYEKRNVSHHLQTLKTN